MDIIWKTAAMIFGTAFQSIVVLSILKSGFLPPDLTPPEDWPSTPRSRELYTPWAIFSPTKTIFD